MEKQPAPTPNTCPHVVDEVIKDLRDRKEHGIAEYGTPLQPFNGRDGRVDLYEELLDAAVYCKQVLMEDHVPVRGSAVHKWLAYMAGILHDESVDALLASYCWHADQREPLLGSK
jgi:hypothetical protein